MRLQGRKTAPALPEQPLGHYVHVGAGHVPPRDTTGVQPQSPAHTFSCLSDSKSCSPQHKAPSRAPSTVPSPYQVSCSLRSGAKDTSRDLRTWAAHGLMENWPFSGDPVQPHNIKDNSHDEDPLSSPRSCTQRPKKHPATAAGAAPGLAPDGQWEAGEPRHP